MQNILVQFNRILIMPTKQYEVIYVAPTLILNIHIHISTLVNSQKNTEKNRRALPNVTSKQSFI